MKIQLIFAVVLVFVATVPVTASFAQNQQGNNDGEDKESIGELAVSASPVKKQVEKGQTPKLSGSVKGPDNNPVANALVKIVTSSDTIWTNTNTKGSFEYEFPKEMEPGIYAVNIMVKKDNYEIGTTSTSFSIKENQNQASQKQTSTEKQTSTQNQVSQKQTSTQKQSKVQNNFKQVSGSEIDSDPVAQKLKEQAEKIQKKVAKQEKKEDEIQKRKEFINKQRKLALEEMQKDLKELKLETAANTPRNAFALFVLQLDEAVQDLFWAQFAFTEKISDRAHQAKLEALEKGMSQEEAMKAFNENAESTRKEIIEHNKKLNIDKGFADKRTQSKFNSAGKIPRDDKN